MAVGAIVLGVLLLSFAVWFFLKRGGGGETGLEPTPTARVEMAEEPTETPTPTPGVKKETISIEVLNGTGIAGEAGKVKTLLSGLGYKEIEAGNAEAYDYEATEVSFASDFPEAYKEEIIDKLKTTFKSVKTTTGSTGKFNVVIVTGLREGQTLGKEATPTKAAGTPSAGSGQSPTPSKTGTPTPTGGAVTVTPTTAP